MDGNVMDGRVMGGSVMALVCTDAALCVHTAGICMNRAIAAAAVATAQAEQ
jgi:hypothetical protein